MNGYLAMREVFAVGGSWLASKRQIAEKQWAAITGQTREALSRAREAAR
jgi:2-dehydro-3-deoxyphosphogluconate aldolase/(4S)-4-hydroxy-2-oxoglutarate aldolase